MQLTTTWKAILLMVFALFGTLIQQSGIPATGNDWIIAGIGVAGTVIVFIGQNILIPSNSTIGNISIQDAVSGLIIGIGAGLSNWIGSHVAGVPVDWDGLKKYIITIVVMYLASVFAQAQTTK